MDQKIKNYLGVTTTIGVIVFATSTFFYAWAYYKSVDTSYASRTFSVTAEGKVTAVPDIAKFTASVIVDGGKDLGAVQKQNTDKMNNVIDFVKNSGVEAKDIRTTNYSVNPRYQNYGCESGVCPPPQIVGYSVNQTIEGKIHLLTKHGDILGGVVKQGANSVSQLSFVVDDPEKAENDARSEAIIKANEKAKKLAKDGGFKIGKIISIYDNSNRPSPMAEGGYGIAGGIQSMAYKSAPSVEPGSREITVSLTVTYEIR